jgi:hypothetical protein
MATYKGIKGFSIQNLSTDPSNPIEGEMWYNSTSNVWKVEELTTAGSWATGGSMSVARNAGGATGSLTTALAFGGEGPSAPQIAATESYDGSTWTSGGTLATARYGPGGAGVQTAALAFGGDPGPPGSGGPVRATTATEEYDGTSWAAGGALNTSSQFRVGSGTQTAGLGYSGNTSDGGPSATMTESYDGTSWTSLNPFNTIRSLAAGAGGGQTDSILFGGFYSPPNSLSAATEEYDGTSWTTANSMSLARRGLGGMGTPTSAIATGGSDPSATTATESYDGTSWTSDTALPSARSGMGSNNFGTGLASMISGGYSAPVGVLSETLEWTGAGAAVTKTITVS